MKGILNERECRRIMKRMEELQRDDDLLSVAEIQEIYETSYDRGLYAAEQRGEEKGIEQEKNNTIQAMLENNMDYETISKITNKSVEEIKEIENSIME